VVVLSAGATSSSSHTHMRYARWRTEPSLEGLQHQFGVLCLRPCLALIEGAASLLAVTNLADSAAGETMLILIVEDEPIVAWSLADVLRESGHAILGPAGSSDEAIQLCAPCMPRLALVDITLHGRVEGIALARRLKSEMSIDSIFMTAQPMLARENADAALGLIEKPYLPELVSRDIAVIDEVLNGHAAHCSALEWFGRSRRQH